MWAVIKYQASIFSMEQLKAQNLWQNALLRDGNKHIHYRPWPSKGVRNVGHLMKDTTSFLSFFSLLKSFLLIENVHSASNYRSFN